MDRDEFEYLAVKFIETVAGIIPKQFASLVFASPLCARSPDLCMLWHTGYREKHRFRLSIELCFYTFIGLLKGLIKLAYNIRPFAYVLKGKIGSSLLVFPSLCGQESKDGSYKTSYVFKKNDDGIFVFGPVADFKKSSPQIVNLAFKEKLIVTYSLAKAGVTAFFAIKGKWLDKKLLLLLWLSWALSFQWLRDYCLETALSMIIEEHNIKKIGCIHEMHAYARVIWRVVVKCQIAGYTVQHAAIAPGKKWYFCYPEEKESGLAFPDVMYVYSHEVAEMLKPCYLNTQFILGCSSRFAHWKGSKPSPDRGSYYLFVGALAGFDNDLLVAALRRLLHSTGQSLPIRMRLHPQAVLSRGVKQWIKSNTKKGLIEISKNIPLKTDIENAIAVIGMGTTVLEEALLLGCPVIHLYHPDYLQYIDIDGIKGVIKRKARELNAGDLVEATSLKVDADAIKRKMGLNHPVVDYEQLFAPNVSKRA